MLVRLFGITIMMLCSPVVNIGTNQSRYDVSEDVGQVNIVIMITSGQKAPGQECQINVTTTDVTATGESIARFLH